MRSVHVRAGRVLVLAAGLALVALAAGCSAETSDTTGGDQGAGMVGESSDVEVDTPELVAQKAAAGIDPCPKASAAPSAVEGGLPAITLPCLGGGRDVDLATLRGPAVINFWAQWCGPCKREAPIFQTAHESSTGDLAVIGVDWMDPRPDAALALADELGLTYPQLADPEGRTRADLGVSGLPFTVFVAADGSVAGVYNGEVDSAEMLADLMTEKLGIETGAGR